MSSMKIILLDGISAIINEENFIKDEIPRYLSSYLEKDYKIWLNVYDSNFDNLEYNCIPLWLSKQIITINEDIFKSINSLNISKESFILTSDLSRGKNLNIKLQKKFKIVSQDEILDFEKIDIADILLCIGFNKTDFFKLCKEQNFLGMDGNEHINLNSKNHRGFAYFVKNDELDQEYKIAYKKFNSLVESRKITNKYNNFTIGLTHKGRGVTGLDLNILNGKKLPLLLI
jgi:hypothetical protein